jgi:hypothetical protein
MNTLTRDEARRQKAGGAAAIYIALALLAAMPFFLLVVDYMGAKTVAEKVALVVANYAGMYAMYLVTYVFYGIALSVLAFALYDRMKSRASATMRVATAIGLLWSFALVASGMIFNYGMTTVAALAEEDTAQAQTAWLAIEPVAQALGGAGGEILGGLWVLLVSAVALRNGALPKLLGWFGVVIGVAGLVSVAPPLRDASIIFGLMLIAWFVWLGSVLIKTKVTVSIVDRPSSGVAS